MQCLLPKNVRLLDKNVFNFSNFMLHHHFYVLFENYKIAFGHFFSIQMTKIRFP